MFKTPETVGEDRDESPRARADRALQGIERATVLIGIAEDALRRAGQALRDYELTEFVDTDIRPADEVGVMIRDMYTTLFCLIKVGNDVVRDMKDSIQHNAGRVQYWFDDDKCEST